MKKILVVNFPESKHIIRLHVLVKSLRESGCEVETLECPFWGDNEKRMKITKRPWLLVKDLASMVAYERRVAGKVHHGNYGMVIIGYPAYLDLFVLSLFCRKKRHTFVTDYFLSVYDTVVLDRKMYKPTSLMANILFALDRKILRSSRMVLTDTEVNSRRYSSLFALDEAKFQRVFVGSRLMVEPMNLEPATPGEVKKVGWVGSFIPLHGIQTILDTALLMKGEKVEFDLIGEGQDFEKSRLFVEQNGLHNVTLHGKCDYIKSMRIMSGCDICLGVFGNSDKAKSVIPFKIFDYLQLGKTIITQQSAVFDELGSATSICQCKACPGELADKIRKAHPSSTSEKDFLNSLLRAEVSPLLDRI